MNLAIKSYKEDTYIIKIPNKKSIFNQRSMFQNAPLKRLNDSTYQFLQPSFRDFFAYKVICRQNLLFEEVIEEGHLLKKLAKNLFVDHKVLWNYIYSARNDRIYDTIKKFVYFDEKEAAVHLGSAFPLIVARALEADKFFKTLPASIENDFNNTPYKPLIKRKNNDFYLNNIFKGEKNISIAAANAMSILNTAGVLFSGVDLSYLNVAIKVNDEWKGPNISGGMFEGTDFTEADLRGALLFWVFFGKANFTNTKLDSTDLGFAKKTFKRHTSSVNSVSFSKDGKYIASGSNDYTVKLWDVSTGKLVKKFKGHTGWVTSVSFSNDGKYIASGSGDQTVKLWDVSTGKLLKEFKGHSSSVTSVSFSNDGKFIASGSYDYTVKIWEFSTEKLLKEFKGHTNYVNSVSFSNDGKFIASGSDDKTVKLWEVSTGKLLKEFKGHSDDVTSVSFSNDGKFIASGSNDRSVCCWRVKDGIMMWRQSLTQGSNIQDAIINGIQRVDIQELVRRGAKRPSIC